VYFANNVPSLYPSGNPIASYPFTYQVINGTGNVTATASQYTTWPGMITNIAAGTYLLIATAIFASGATPCHVDMSVWYAGSNYGATTKWIPTANTWTSATLCLIVSSAAVQQLALNAYTTTAGVTLGYASLFGVAQATRIVLLKIG
jgi:hypothetical protein